MKKKVEYKGHELFFIQSNNKTYLLYAPTLKLLLRITERFANFLSSNLIFEDSERNKEYGTLLKIFENAFLKTVVPIQIKKQISQFFHLALGITKDCTLNCLYCHAEAGKKEEMTDEIRQAALDYAFKTAKNEKLKRVNISFAVGGEPTTNWKNFKKCIEDIKSNNKKYNIPYYLSMTTNGYYGNTKRKYLVDNIDSILLSFDGPEYIQNYHRPNKAGKGSFRIIKESAKYFVKNAKSFSIRSTVSNLSVTKMEHIVEFFHSEIGNNFDIVFEPLIPMGRGAENIDILKEPDKKDFISNFIKAKKLGNKKKINVLTSAANQKRLVTGFCGAMTIPSFTVTTNGKITTCERDSDGNNYGYGEFDKNINDFVFDNAKKRKNYTLTRITKKCEDCFCKWHCAGDCPDLKTIGYDRCEVNKELIKFELESLLN